jgi:hypothetical protein
MNVNGELLTYKSNKNQDQTLVQQQHFDTTKVI